MRTVVMYFSFNKIIGYYGRLEAGFLFSKVRFQVREPRARVWSEQAQYG